MRAATLLALSLLTLNLPILGCVDVPDPADPVDAAIDGPPVGSDRGMPPDAGPMLDGAPGDMTPLDGMPPDVASMDLSTDDAEPDAAQDAMPIDAMPIDAVIRRDAMPVDAMPVDAMPVDAMPPPACRDDEIYAVEVELCVRFERLPDLPQAILEPLTVALEDDTLLVVDPGAGGDEGLFQGGTYTLPPGAADWVVDNGPAPRSEPTLTHVPGVGTLLVGGKNDRADALDSIEIRNAEAGVWVFAQGLAQARRQHAAVRFEDGLIVLGGRGEMGSLASAERLPLDVRNDPVPDLPAPRHGHLAAPLDGGLMVVGGVIEGEVTGESLFWFGEGPWNSGRGADLPALGDGAAVGSDGRTVLLGGGDNADGEATDALFVWRRGEGWAAVDPLAHDRKRHTITALDDDLFLVVGSNASIELIRTDTGARAQVAAPDEAIAARRRHTAVALEGPAVAIVGGKSGDPLLASVWRISVYDANRIGGPR